MFVGQRAIEPPDHFRDLARKLFHVVERVRIHCIGGHAISTGRAADTQIDPASLHNYLSFHGVVPAPRTIFKGVSKLPPATLMTIEPDGTRREETYWTLNVETRAEDRRITQEEWSERVLDAVSVAVRRRMVADVPVGVLLSGGLEHLIGRHQYSAIGLQPGFHPRWFLRRQPPWQSQKEC